MWGIHIIAIHSQAILADYEWCCMEAMAYAFAGYGEYHDKYRTNKESGNDQLYLQIYSCIAQFLLEILYWFK